MKTLDAAPRATMTLHYVFSALMLSYFLVVKITCSRCVVRRKSQTSVGLTKSIIGLQAALVSLHVLDSIVVIFRTCYIPGRSVTHTNVPSLVETVVWIAIFAVMIEGRPNTNWYPFWGCWIIGLACELTLISLKLPLLSPTALDFALIALQVFRMTVLSLLLLFYFHRTSSSGHDEESSPLLREHQLYNTPNSSKHSGWESNQECHRVSKLSSDYSEETRARGNMPDLLYDPEHLKSWKRYLTTLRIFLPLFWPSEFRSIRLCTTGIAFIFCLRRILMILLPRQLGILIDSMFQSPLQFNRDTGYQLGLLLFYQYLATPIAGHLESLCLMPLQFHAQRSIKLAIQSKIIESPWNCDMQDEILEIWTALEDGKRLLELFRFVTILLMPVGVDLLVAFIYLSNVFGGSMLVLLLAIVVLSAWSVYHFQIKALEKSKMGQTIARNESRILVENATYWASISSFSRQAYEKERLLQVTNDVFENGMIMHRITSHSTLLNSLFATSCVAIACVLVRNQITSETKEVGCLPMLILYFHCIIERYKLLPYGLSRILQCLEGAKELRRFLLRKPQVADGHDPFRYVKGEVVIENVSFSYNRRRKVLRDLSLRANSGQKIALVGRSGAGKTSILKLLFRLYDVDAGSIMVDGQNIRDVTLDTLRRYIGVVPQNTLLNNDTIMENVRYGSLHASDKDVVDACKAAALHEQILSYADGYGTYVGNSGVKLSSSEMQRVMIARNILKNPMIVIIDENTSNLDAEADSLLQTAVQNLTSGKTSFIVTNRHGFRIEEGRIGEQGPPQKLFKFDSKLSSLFKNQVREQNSQESNTGPRPSCQAVSRNLKKYGRHSREKNDSSASTTFRPNAPEFVPSCQRETAASGGQASHSHPSSSNQQNYENLSTHSYNPSKPSNPKDAGSRRPVHVQQKVDPDADRPEDMPVQTNIQERLNQQYDGAAEQNEGVQKGQYLNRRQRRRLAKSDPQYSEASKGQPSSLVDGQASNPRKQGSGLRHISVAEMFPASKAPEANTGDNPSYGAKEQKQPRPRRQRQRIRKHREDFQPEKTSNLPHESSSAGANVVKPSAAIPTAATTVLNTASVQ